MKNNLLSLLALLTLLSINCISCSHNKAISADAGLTDENTQASVTTEEGSDNGAVESASPEAAKEADSMVAKTDVSSAPLDATASNLKLGEDPLLLGMESTANPEDLMKIAQATVPAVPLNDGKTALDNSVTKVNNSKSSNNLKKEPVTHSAEKSGSTAPAPKQVGGPIAGNIDDPFADELTNNPIPEPEKPKLASAEISSFIERHAFWVTLCGVCFIFGVFILMRRRSDHGDHDLTV